MLTSHVVVSLPLLTVYRTFHQPSSVSPDGVRPEAPYEGASGTLIVIHEFW